MDRELPVEVKLLNLIALDCDDEGYNDNDIVNSFMNMDNVVTVLWTREYVVNELESCGFSTVPDNDVDLERVAMYLAVYREGGIAYNISCGSQFADYVETVLSQGVLTGNILMEKDERLAVYYTPSQEEANHELERCMHDLQCSSDAQPSSP